MALNIRLGLSLSKIFSYTRKHLQNHVPVCNYNKKWDYEEDEDSTIRRSWSNKKEDNQGDDFISRRSGFNEREDNQDDNFIPRKSRFKEREYNQDDDFIPRRSRFRENNRDDKFEYISRSRRSFDNPRHDRMRYHDDYNQRSNMNQSFNSIRNEKLFSFASDLKAPDWASESLEPFEKNFLNTSILSEQIDPEEVKAFRESHGIIVVGKDVPDPVMSFSHCQFPSEVNGYISKFGFENPTPIQAQTWPIVLSGKDLVGIGQTGSGKTLGYIIPGIIHVQAQERPSIDEGPNLLVLAPTRELVQQITKVTEQISRPMGLNVVSIFGGASRDMQARSLRVGPSLCIATPGRLLDFLSSDVTNLKRCTYLVLDEADRMLDMGFEPQIKKILNMIRNDRQTLMWSATWPKDVQMLASKYLSDSVQVNIGSTELHANKNITQTVHIIEPRLKIKSLFEICKQELEDGNGKILIFAETKRTVDFIVDTLRRKRVKATGIHSDYSQSGRDNALTGFREGYFEILVATNVASRGLDVNDISLVVNYDFPTTIEEYIHRIGRTARALKSGKAHSFFTENGSSLTKDLIKVLKDSNQEVNEELLEMGGAQFDRSRRYR